MSQKTPFYHALPVIVLSSLLVMLVVFAWTEPTQAPPGENVPAPINTGTTTQYKDGALGIGGVFRAYSNAIFDDDVTAFGPGNIYEKSGTFECDAGDTPIAYRTYPNSCGHIPCKRCVTGYHGWTPAPDGQYQETCQASDYWVFACTPEYTCYATPAVRCQKPSRPYLEINDNGIFIRSKPAVYIVGMCDIGSLSAGEWGECSFSSTGGTLIIQVSMDINWGSQEQTITAKIDDDTIYSVTRPPNTYLAQAGFTKIVSGIAEGDHIFKVSKNIGGSQNVTVVILERW